MKEFVEEIRRRLNLSKDMIETDLLLHQLLLSLSRTDFARGSPLKVGAV